MLQLSSQYTQIYYYEIEICILENNHYAALTQYYSRQEILVIRHGRIPTGRYVCQERENLLK